MSERTLHQTILVLLEDDTDLLEQMRDADLLPRDEAALLPEHAETARVVQTLLQELEIPWEGVEVILRMRDELLATRRQLGDLLSLLRGDDHDGR